MCAVCDSAQQDKFIMDQRKIVINQKQCSDFVDNCGEHIKSLNALTFYLTHFYRMAKCSDFGQFKGTPEWVLMNESSMNALNTCRSTQNPDDCSEVCRNEFSFSSTTNFEAKKIAEIHKFANLVEETWKDEYIKGGGKIDEGEYHSIDDTYSLFGLDTGIRKLQEEPPKKPEEKVE